LKVVSKETDCTSYRSKRIKSIFNSKRVQIYKSNKVMSKREIKLNVQLATACFLVLVGVGLLIAGF